MVKIRELRWDSGNLTYEKIRRDILSSKEKDYYSSYNEIISDYCASLDLDLTSSIEAIHTKKNTYMLYMIHYFTNVYIGALSLS